MKVTGRQEGNYGRGARRRRCQGSHRGPEWLGLGESGEAPRGGDAGAAFEEETGSFPSRTGRAGAPVPWGRPATWASNRSSVGRTAVFR